VALSVVASYITSLGGLKELTDGVAPKWLATLVRAIKQFAQTAAAYIGAAVLLSDVNWNDLLVVAATSAAMSVLQSVLTSLPETQPLAEVETEPVEATVLERQDSGIIVSEPDYTTETRVAEHD
jgi:hypothetical protein